MTKPFTKPIRRAVLALAALMAGALPAAAHHSFAMFNSDAKRELVGTVKDFQRVNPHGYLDVVVKTKSGNFQTWSIELQSVLQLGREKINGDTFKPGDKVSVIVHPLRDGTTGGAFISAVLADGSVVGAVTP